MLPSAPGASDTNVSTPTTAPLSFTAGPPELPHAAEASVWMNGWPDLSSLNPDTVPLVTVASMDADSLSSSWESTTPGNPMIWMESPISAPFESVRGSTGYVSPGILSSARSRADMAPGSRLTGGAYFLTSALTRLPFETTTTTCGIMLTLADGSTLSSSLRLTASSASGFSPGTMRARSRALGRQAVITARCACWFTSQRGVSYAGWTTWPFVTTQPSPSMNQPVPVSRKTGGVTLVGPLPQSSVTSAATSAITRTTAGLARSSASCTENGRWAKTGEAPALHPQRSASHTRKANRSIMRRIAALAPPFYTKRTLHEPPDW